MSDELQFVDGTNQSPMKLSAFNGNAAKLKFVGHQIARSR